MSWSGYIYSYSSLPNLITIHGKIQDSERGISKEMRGREESREKKEMKGFKWFSDPRTRKTEQCQYTSLLPHELMKMVIRI